MTDKIEVGEYVKNQNGIIRKIVDIYNGKLYVDKLYYDKENEYFYEQYEFMIEDEIIKHSKNILDLIEVGDLLHIKIRNAHEFIYYILDEDYLKMVKQNTKGDEWWKIKSIVTHEQFNEMEYRINE